MVQVKIILLQGEIKFTPKFTPEQILHVRRQFAQPIKHLSLNSENTLNCLNYPRFIDNEKEIENEFDYIVGLLQAVKSKVRFSGEILGYRYSNDERKYKKCRWFVKKDEKYFTYEYIEFRIVKQGKKRGPRPKADDRVLEPPDQEQYYKVDIDTQTEKSRSNQGVQTSQRNLPQRSIQRSTKGVQASNNSPSKTPQRSTQATQNSPSKTPQRSTQATQNSPSKTPQRSTPPPSKSTSPVKIPSRPESPLDPNDKYASLKDGHQIEDEPIDDYMKLLVNKGKDRERWGKLLVLPSHVYGMLLLASRFEKDRAKQYYITVSREYFKHKDITDLGLILLPANIDGHWAFYGIRVHKDRKWLEINGYDSHNCELGEEYLEVIKKYLRFIGVNYRITFDHWTGPSVEEEDSIDCGAYMLEIARSILHDEKADRFTQKNIPAIRKRIKKELTDKKLVSNFKYT